MADIAVSAVPPEKNRMVGLVVFGLLQFALGGLCALLVLLLFAATLLSASMDAQGGPQPTVASMIPALLIYLSAAVWFVTMGIGSMRGMRWARALTLVSSWLWLILGAFGTTAAMVVVPSIYRQMGERGQLAAHLVGPMTGFVLVFLLIFMVALPGSLVLFYRSRHVKATVERKDPTPRWTDATPLPVLGACLMSAFMGVSYLSMAAYNWVVPFFGTITSGPVGAVVVLTSCATFLYAAWGMRKLDMRAWWVALVLMATWGVSIFITLARHDLADYNASMYAAMEMSEEQLAQIADIPMPNSIAMAAYVGLLYFGGLAYIVYIRRFFHRGAN